MEIYKQKSLETNTGVLPVSPISLTGKYKLVISGDKLFLDDYNNRRIVIDKNQRILPQIANFLKVNTSPIDENKTRYAGYRNNTVLSWHTTLHINSDIQSYPKLFVLNTITNFGTNNHFDKKIIPDISKYFRPFKIIDLEKCGVLNVLREINDTINKHFMYVNYDDNYCICNGYDIMEETVIQRYFDLKYLLANQSDLNYVNSKILEYYSDNNMIYPRFINIEYEFEYTYNLFQNFFGYYSIPNYIDKNDIQNIDVNKQYIKIKDYDNFKYIDNPKNIVLDKYHKIFIQLPIIKVNTKPPQVRLGIKTIFTGDYFRIHHKDGSVIYEYEFTDDDFVHINNAVVTIYSVLKQVTNRISIDTNNLLTFDVKHNYKSTELQITMYYSSTENLVEDYFVTVSKNISLLDESKYFRKINSNDFKINQIIDTPQLFNGITKLSHNNGTNDDDLSFVEIFRFDGDYYIRFTDESIKKLESNKSINSYISFYHTEIENLVRLDRIPYLSYNDDLYTEKQYNNLNFIGLLQKHKDKSPEFDKIIQEYSESIIFEDILPYVNEKQNKYVANVPTENYNTKKVQSILFKSIGFGTHFNPVIFNFDKRFYEKGNIVNYNLLEKDEYKYHWFLIKTDIPELLNESIRYFTDKPRITSTLYQSFEGSNFVETIFLGVKYRLPIRYDGYEFAVYLNTDNQLLPKLHYQFIVDDSNKQIYLEVNKFFDFIDLIQAGIDNNPKIIDLSFIYNIRKTYNSNSKNVTSFDYGGLLIADDKIPTIFDGNTIKDWKVYDTKNNRWLICIKKSQLIYTPDLDKLISVSNNNQTDYDFYIYSNFTDNNKQYIYLSVKYTIQNIQKVESDYIWAENLIVKFFDTKEYYVEIDTKNNGKSTYLVINDLHDVIVTEKLPNDNVINKTVLIYDEKLNNKIPINLKFLNNKHDFDLRKEYFSVKIKNVINPVTNKIQRITEHFVFPEFNLLPNDNNLQNSLIEKYVYNTDYKYKEFEITIFERNQLWLLIRELASTSIQLKSNVESKELLNDLLLYNLEKHTLIDSIPTKNTNRFIKLDCYEPSLFVVQWNHKLNRLQRLSTWYNPYLPIINDEYEFQKQLYLNDTEKYRLECIQSLWNKHYLSENVNATGIYEEINSTVSSLFCKYDNIVLEVISDKEEYDYYQELSNKFIIDRLIFHNDNREYIEKFNKNVNQYIFEVFLNKLVMEWYQISSITNNDERITFVEIDKFKVKIDTRFIDKPIKIIFTRR